MKKEDSYLTIRIRKRPWYAWLFWIGWLLFVLFWLEVAVGSFKEYEYRAFYISLAVFLITLIDGILIWLWGIIKRRRMSPS